jgi:O-antigen/teichoic acid export membrane protein
MTQTDSAQTPPAEPADVLDTDEAGPKAIRGGAIRLVVYVMTVLVSVVSSAVLYRHLRVVLSGYYVTIISLVTLCGGLTDAGLSGIGVRELATRTGQERRRFMRELSGLRLVLALLGVVVAVAFAASAGYGSVRIFGAAIFGVSMLLVVLQDTFAISLIARLQITWVALADLLRVVVLAIAIVCLAVAGAGLLPFYAASIPAALAAVLVLARLVRNDIPLLPSFHHRSWNPLLSDTLAYSLATAVAAIYFRIAIIVVSLISSGRQTGFFSVSFRVVEVLAGLPILLVGVTFPIFARAARDDRARLSYAAGRVFDTMFLLGLGGALALAVGAPFIVAVIGGPRFHPSEAVLRIQGLALIATFTGAVWGFTLLSLHRHRAILVASLVALVLTIVLTGTLASVDGAKGAAVGAVISEFAFVTMMAAATFRTGVRPRINRTAIPRALLAAGAGACVLAIPNLPSVVRMLLALVIYAAVLLLLRAVPDELLAQVWLARSWLRR